MTDPTLTVRAKARTGDWFNPADAHEVTGLRDRPAAREVVLATWEEPHGTGYAVKEIVIPYSQVPVLYEALNQVLSDEIQRIAAELTKRTTELTQAKKALQTAAPGAYRELFTRKEGKADESTRTI
jgi:hypothetical protein